MYNTFMSNEQTTPLTIRIRYRMSEIWLRLLGIIYDLTPLQRIAIVGGLIAMIPAYWIWRFATYHYLTYKYEQRVFTARPAFTSSEPLSITQTGTLTTIDDSYVAYFQIQNPNKDLAVSNAQGKLRVFDASNVLLSEQDVKFYLLPGQKRIIPSTIFRSSSMPKQVKVENLKVSFQKRFEIPSVEIATKNGSIEQGQSVPTTSAITNQSPFTLAKVEILHIFYNSSNKISGLFQRAEFTVRPEETRDYPLDLTPWDTSQITRMETAVFSNPLDSKNLNSR